MKKWLWIGGLIGSMVSPSLAIAPTVWIASTTATADSGKGLCPIAGVTTRAVLHGVCVNTGVAGSLTIYNAVASAANAGPVIDTTAKGCNTYDVALSSGLSYTNSATANVTITYACY